MRLKHVNLTGQQFFRLTAIERVGDLNKGRVTWECQCACGAKKVVEASRLLRGTAKSCGCWKKECRKTHGNTTQGARTPEYCAWVNMKNRVKDAVSPNHKNYAGRGIGVCERWDIFENFLADVGQRPTSKHTVERVNNDLGYSPENCKWGTRTEQSRNRRNRHILTYKGETKCVGEWADLTKLPLQTIYSRLRFGYTPEEALETPRHAGRKRALVS